MLTPGNWAEGPFDVIPPLGPFEESSLYSRPISPSKLGTSKTFDGSVKDSALDLANEFTDSPTLLQGLRDSQIAPGGTTLLIIEAATSRAKSVNSAKTVIKHVKGLIHFYLDARNESAATLTGEWAVSLLRDFLEFLRGRGRTVPSAAKHYLTVWADALGIDWPLTNPLVLSAATVESNEDPRQAPAMDVETVRKLEDTASNVESLIKKRAFAAGILLMTYAILRFADVQKIRVFGVNADSIHGTILTSKTKKQHGLHWPRACPRMGITKRTDWIQPLLELRNACQKVNGVPTSYTFPRLDHTWALVAEGATPYSTTRRKLALLCVGLGGLKGESYTLHSPKNLFPTAANQMSFGQKELDNSCPDRQLSVAVWLSRYTFLVACTFDHLSFPTDLLA